METEIELKFFVEPEFADVLRKKIAQHKVLQHSSRELGNIYFDTPDNWLRQHDIGMRIRSVEGARVQTVKTAGRVVAGLHQRPEFNAPIDSDQPDVNLHPEDIWPEQRDLEQLQDQLAPLFQTNFMREQWLVGTTDGSQIEVAFDQGVVEAANKQSPICEVELELKSGQTDALFSLARELSESGGMRLGNMSKAARGYRLAFDAPAREPKPITLVNTRFDDSAEDCLINSLEHALSQWLYHDEVYTELDSIEALIEVRNSTSYIRHILAMYGEIVPRRASAILRQELKWLEQELEWVYRYQCIDELTEDKGHVLRKLDAKKVLVKQLKHERQQLPNREQVLALFASARYTGLILDLNRWLLTRGWQPFLDDKARKLLASSIKAFSKQQLDYTWKELMDTFPVETFLDAQAYKKEYYKLSRCLYTGISFASIYDKEERMRFRLPWHDLLEGIHDLVQLDVLTPYLAALEGDEKEQLERWLARQQSSILHAMEQTRTSSLEARPYWRED
jgi:triphosphatase